MINDGMETKAVVTLGTAVLDNPTGYGRIKRLGGKVAGIVGLVARMLYAVVLRHNAAERLGGLHHRLLDPCNSVRLLNEMHQRMHRHRILTHVQHVVPSLMAVG